MPELRARPPHQNRIPSGSAAATRSKSRVDGGSGASRSLKLCSIRSDNAGPSDSQNPPASSAGVQPRGSSSRASGLPARLGHETITNARVEWTGDHGRE